MFIPVFIPPNLKSPLLFAVAIKAGKMLPVHSGSVTSYIASFYSSPIKPLHHINVQCHRLVISELYPRAYMS